MNDPVLGKKENAVNTGTVKNNILTAYISYSPVSMPTRNG
jgi:hypothetical protein